MVPCRLQCLLWPDLEISVRDVLRRREGLKEPWSDANGRKDVCMKAPLDTTIYLRGYTLGLPVGNRSYGLFRFGLFLLLAVAIFSLL